MKVVTCKNCGANYQLEDDDDIGTFECSSCAGNLELVEEYPSETKSKRSSLFSIPIDDTDYITECTDCGLKYRLDNKENIADYECESCGGTLKHVDESLNKELEKVEKENKTDKKDDKKPKKENMFKSVSNRVDNAFSEDKINLNASSIQKTARTKIPSYIRSKFEKDFDISKVRNYDTLNNYLKKNFYKGIEKDYYFLHESEKRHNITQKSFFDKISVSEPTDKPKSDKHDLIPYPNELNTSYHYLYIIAGVLLGAIGLLDIFTSNRGYGIIFLFIGLIILIFGIYKSRDYGETEKRGKIIREKLLTLPNEYYVLYYVKVPESSEGINHVVIGPSGIYSIVTQKYYSKDSEGLQSEKENNELINSIEEKQDEFSKEGNKFKYTVRKEKFPHNDKIKQKSLKLGENLVNFLFENGFENCFVEPLVGFVNNDVAVINMPLTDEDLFLDELINKIRKGPEKLDNVTVHKCAVVLSQYATECST
ncbi:NERD domain-containing protein [Methanobrevibacter sp. DSM 116169]|uniref:NERD domain-containing protein n=1 Tax=Methanobrevibacter sp. DSM 116169 TaxID=3242727 RepID=UPI0038FC3CEA